MMAAARYPATFWNGGRRLHWGRCPLGILARTYKHAVEALQLSQVICWVTSAEDLAGGREDTRESVNVAMMAAARLLLAAHDRGAYAYESMQELLAFGAQGAHSNFGTHCTVVHT